MTDFLCCQQILLQNKRSLYRMLTTNQENISTLFSLKSPSGHFSGETTSWPLDTYIWYLHWAKSRPFLSFILFPSHRTSTSCMACTWTPQHLPCSTRAESKASIRMILRRPGVSFRSTLSRSTWALSTLSQMTVEMSAGMTSKRARAHAPLCEYQRNRRRKGTEQNRMGHLISTLGKVSRETSEPHRARMIKLISSRVFAFVFLVTSGSVHWNESSPMLWKTAVLSDTSGGSSSAWRWCLMKPDCMCSN